MFDGLKRTRRSIKKDRPKKTVELIIAADKYMVERYTKEFIHTFLVAQGSMVSIQITFSSK